MTEPAAETTVGVVAHRSRLRTTAETVLRNRLAVFGLVILVLLVLVALAAPLIAPYTINQVDVANRLQGPSSQHWFGTDELGRDVFSRVIIASRVSLQVGFVSVGIALGLGVPVGLIAGYYGGRIDSISCG